MEPPRADRDIRDGANASPTPSNPRDFACVTWNVHRGRGRDGRVDPERIARVLIGDVLAEPVDVLALQEADAECPPHAGILDIGAIEAATGLRHAHPERALRWGDESHGFLGSILFVAPHVKVEAAAIIDLPGHCHRGAVVLELAAGEARLRVIGTHLSLGQPLRAVQMRVIGQHLRRGPALPTVILGDLNEWRPWGGVALSKAMLGRAFSGPVRATFPATRPILPLDRILCDRKGAVHEVAVLDSPGIREASDHRPLRARIRLDAPA